MRITLYIGSKEKRIYSDPSQAWLEANDLSLEFPDTPIRGVMTGAPKRNHAPYTFLNGAVEIG